MMKKIVRTRTGQDETSTPSPISEADVYGVRTTKRIKKPKAVFDPSDNNMSRAQRQSISSLINAFTSASAEQRTSRDPTIFQSQRLRRSPTSGHLTGDAPSNDLCYICKIPGSGLANKILDCTKCDRKVHNSCLKINFADMEGLHQTFECDYCRLCDVCQSILPPGPATKQKDVDLATCTICVKSYHISCHVPNVVNYKQLQRTWQCNQCSLTELNRNSGGKKKDKPQQKLQPQPVVVKRIVQMRKSLTSSEDSEPLRPPKMQKVSPKAEPKTIKTIATSNAGGTTGSNVKRSQLSRKIFPNDQTSNGDTSNNLPSTSNSKNAVSDDIAKNAAKTGSNTPVSNDSTFQVPNVRGWDVDQVFNYLSQFFPEEAPVFKEQEIDGASILLLRRSDIITKLPFKLGPALRLYSLILKVQTNIDDDTLGWNCEN